MQREQIRIARLIELATVMQYDRRQILRRALAFGLSAPAIATVLAACLGDDDDDDVETTDPETREAVPDEDEPGGESTPTETAGDEEPTTEQPDDPTETASEDEQDATEEDERLPTQEDDGDDDAPGGTINVASTSSDEGIGNPILNNHETWVEFLCFNKLFMFDDRGELQPFLAESWEYSDDYQELTLNLAEANWHDGEPFDADDVIFTLDAIADENTDTPDRSRLQVNGEFIDWEKVDDRTVRLTLPEPFAPLLFNINAIGIIPEHILADEDINTSDFNLNPIGTGPFRLTEWQRAEFIRFERNDDYFKGEVMADGYTVYFTEDVEANVIALENGDLDMVFVTSEFHEEFEDHEDFVLNTYAYFTSITLAFNHRHPILQDIEIRRAMEMAIDKEGLTASVTDMLGSVSHNQYAEDGPLDQYNDYENVEIPEYDPEAAGEMLDDLGWTVGEDGVRQREGERLEFNMITYAGFDEYQSGMILLQNQLEQVGIMITPNVVAFSTLESMWADPDDDPADRALELEEWPHPYEFDPDVFNELHSANHPPQGNYMWYANQEVDALIEEGRRTINSDDRIDIYRELDVLRSQDLPCIPLYVAVDGWLVSRNIRNRDGEVATSPYYRQYRLYAVDEIWKDDSDD
ncbi:MAG: ABC transporter substrate-binding protein [Chloroflexota bacterium]